MDLIDAARLGTIISKSDTEWKLEHFVKTRNSYFAVVTNKRTHQPKTLKDEEAWRELIENPQ